MKVFFETQRFDQWWFRLIMLIVTTIVIMAMVAAYRSVKSDPVAFWTVSGSSIFTIFLIVALVFLLKLETKINELGIHYRFWPFKLKLINWSDIEKCFVRNYRPIKEYGGWGYKLGIFRKKGSAVNVKGNIGIQIVFKSGKQFLIGTQKEVEAKKVLETYTHKLQSHEG